MHLGENAVQGVVLDQRDALAADGLGDVLVQGCVVGAVDVDEATVFVEEATDGE